MELIELEGTPGAMGRTFGRRCRDAVHGLYRARLANALEQARTYGGRALNEARLLAVAARCLPLVRDHHPEGFEELSGIAEGADMDLARIWAMNALTDLRDYAAYAEDLGAPSAPEGEGCTAIVVGSGRSATGGCLAGQTWDLSTDNLPFVCLVRRRPSHGPATVCLTTVGCLSLIGVNEAGVAVGTTNLRTTDVQLGVGYLDVIHRALSQDCRAAATRAVREATRMAAHFFWVVDAAGAVAIEGSGRAALEATVAPEEVYVHANHALTAPVRAVEAAGTPMASSHHRQARAEVLTRAAPRTTPEALRAMLGDGEGAELAICRRDFAGISTNGALVVDPGQGSAWAVQGPPADADWLELPVR